LVPSGATGYQETLPRELTALERHPDLGRLAAQVDLVRGAHLLGDSARQDEGRSAVHRALSARADLASVLEDLEKWAEVRARPGRPADPK
jgi:hypothetical protein